MADAMVGVEGALSRMPLEELLRRMGAETNATVPPPRARLAAALLVTGATLAR